MVHTLCRNRRTRILCLCMRGFRHLRQQLVHQALCPLSPPADFPGSLRQGKTKISENLYSSTHQHQPTNTFPLPSKAFTNPQAETRHSSGTKIYNGIELFPCKTSLLFVDFSSGIFIFFPLESSREKNNHKTKISLHSNNTIQGKTKWPPLRLPQQYETT